MSVDEVSKAETLHSAYVLNSYAVPSKLARQHAIVNLKTSTLLLVLKSH